MIISPSDSQKGASRIHYSMKNQEAMLIQNDYCSPQSSHRSSSKQAPKSILKEYSNSAFKSKKDIMINEKLNKTQQISSQKVSDIQKAYSRKQQRQREQELLDEIETSSDIKQNSKSHEGIKYVEHKIQQLEKCLDIYSKRLRDSIFRQRDQLLASHYKNSDDISDNNLKGVLENWKGKKSVIVDQISLSKDILNENEKNKIGQNNSERQSYNLYPSKFLKELGQELDQFKQDQNYLKNILSVSDSILMPSSREDRLRTSGHILNKEIELLKTIEQIRTKLNASISKRVLQRKNKQVTNILLKTKLQKTKTNQFQKAEDIVEKNDDIPLKCQKLRKAYGSTVLERENACFLNQGLSTTYNSFHWNTDQSLKIIRIL